MSSYVTPDMILRSAEEYMKLDQKQNAFNLLFEYLTGKKSRPWSQALEKIMFIIIDLALEFDKKELLSMPLNNYKFATQTNNIASLETVLNYFAKGSEEKHEAIAKLITPEIVATIDDLESEDPSELFIWAFDVDSRTEKSIIRDSMKRLWETYKILIDITARNKKLEDFYQRILQKAFTFCKKYKRRTEFKRLCELTRSHLNSVLRTSAVDLAKMPNAIDLSNIDTNDKQIQIRFELLEYIQEFELWQESIKTLEDIHHIMQKRRSAAKSKTLYDYFEHLSKVFLKSEFFYYSTVAFFNHYSLLRTRQKNVSIEELTQKSNTFVLSVLCIPPVLHENLQPEDTRVRATSLLSSETTLPSKSDLILYIKKHNILDICTKEVRDIYFLIEESKNMIDLSKNSEPLLKVIREKYSIFHKQLQNNIILKLLTLLSKLYTKIKIDNFSKFLGSLDSSHCDQLIHTASLSDYIKVRIDHGRRLLIFQDDVQEMQNLSLKFVNFSEDLKEVIYSIDNKKEQGKEQKVIQGLREEARRYTESATGALSRRLQIIQDLRKIEREQNKQRAQPEERVGRQEPVSRPVEKQVNAAAAKRADTLATFKIQAKLNLIKKLKEIKGFKIGKRKIEDFADEEFEVMTLESLEKAQGDWEKKEKERDEAAIKNAFKRADHYERAKREVFINTLKKKWEDSKGEKEEILKTHKENFEKMIEYKKKMVKAEKFRGEFTNNLVEKKLEDFENEMEVYREKIIDNFKQKIIEAAKESLKAQIEAQEAERKRKEEQLAKEKERLEKDRDAQAKDQQESRMVRNTVRAEDMQKQAEAPRTTGGFTRSEKTAEEAKATTGGFQRSELKPKEEAKEAPKFFRSTGEKKNPFGDAKPVETTAAPTEDGGWRTQTKKQETKTEERPKFGFSRGTGTTSTTTTSGTTSGGPPKFTRGAATTTENTPAQSTGGWRKS